ncbi:hypothetical protein HYN69_11520 [Gemmobacter aquarius]|uniref:Uncharacterized protein n=1 Tax=Paragemmobacter aquarius TaxID=2169400 RepID=A0A2S0UML5_9RHOB|nr:hypothetical protein [Gemmobacter aquarius]AWB49046.1 hypothetical protein HYN69_11520 [Gemmobacter aquarius]
MYKRLKKALPFHGYVDSVEVGLFVGIIPILAGAGLGLILGLGDEAALLLIVGLVGLAYIYIHVCVSRDKDP